MLLSDRVTGLAVAAIGGLAFYGGSLLPPMRGQPVGPSVFPMVIGAAIIVCGLLIAGGIGRHFEEEAEAELAASADHAPPVAATRPGWFAGLPPALLLFYVLVSERLGFIPTAAIMVAVAAKAFGASTRLTLAVALAAPPIVHLVFYKLLRVPLPAGLVPMPW